MKYLIGFVILAAIVGGAAWSVWPEPSEDVSLEVVQDQRPATTEVIESENKPEALVEEVEPINEADEPVESVTDTGVTTQEPQSETEARAINLDSTATAGWVEYVDPVDGFTLLHPEDWIVLDMSQIYEAFPSPLHSRTVSVGGDEVDPQGMGVPPFSVNVNKTSLSELLAVLPSEVGAEEIVLNGVPGVYIKSEAGPNTCLGHTYAFAKDDASSYSIQYVECDYMEPQNTTRRENVLQSVILK